MLRKTFVIAALALLPAAMARAEFEAGNWTLELAASAANDSDFSGASIGLDFALGHFLTKELEVGLRQAIDWTDLVGTSSSGSSWNATSQGFVDYHFDMDRWQPFIGFNAGYTYGDGVRDTISYGPEAGVKYFVNSTTYIGFLVQYQVFCNEGDDSDSFQDGAFLYSLGIGFKW